MEKIINHWQTAQIAVSGFLNPQWNISTDRCLTHIRDAAHSGERDRPNFILPFLQIIKKPWLPKSLPAGFSFFSEETGPIPACSFYVLVSMRRNDPVLSTIGKHSPRCTDNFCDFEVMSSKKKFQEYSWKTCQCVVKPRKPWCKVPNSVLKTRS